MNKPKKVRYLYLTIKEELLEMISKLGPSDRLPSRNRLMKKFNAARTTIDRAVSELIDEGYLYARDGSGTYVSETTSANQDSHNSIKTIGLIIPNITSYNYPDIVRGIQDVADLNDYNIIISNTDNQLQKQQFFIDRLIQSKVNGIIIAPVFYDIETTSFKMLQSENIPFVFCNRGIDGVNAPIIAYNNFYGAFLATNHLIQSGCKHIGFLSSPLYSISRERLHGYIAALNHNQLEVKDELIKFEDYRADEQYGIIGIKELLSQNKPDGVICTDDIIAYNALCTVLDMGISIPDEISFVGFGDSIYCEKSPVKLTSIRYNKYEIGFNSATMLLNILENKQKTIQDRTSIPELIIRKSTRGYIN